MSFRVRPSPLADVSVGLHRDVSYFIALFVNYQDGSVANSDLDYIGFYDT